MKSTKPWIDITITIKPGMVHWPGDPEIMIKRTSSINQGDSANVSHLSMGSHTGTHMDAPLHFLPKGKGLDRIPLEAVIGPARVLEIKDPQTIKIEEIKKYNIQAGEKILFKTRNSSRLWKTNIFSKDYVYITHETAEYLAKKKIRTLGVDYLSVGGFKKDGRETHRALLSKNIWLIEGLNLSKVKAGRYELICLPLKILNSDGAPARALLRQIH